MLKKEHEEHIVIKCEVDPVEDFEAESDVS